MADIPLTRVSRTSSFVPDFVSLTQEIPSGNTGVLATITPPPGKRAAIIHLQASAIAQPGISLEVGGVITIPVGALGVFNAAFTAGQFAIGLVYPSSVGQVVAIDPGLPIVVRKNAGNTGTVIRYIYAYGD